PIRPQRRRPRHPDAVRRRARRTAPQGQGDPAVTTSTPPPGEPGSSADRPTGEGTPLDPVTDTDLATSAAAPLDPTPPAGAPATGVTRTGMFGGTGSGDTSGFGLLQREAYVPPATPRPFGGPRRRGAAAEPGPG